MATREHDFITGFETSTAPTAATPSADDDVVNKGYADDTYAVRSSYGAQVADTAALQAIPAAGDNSRSDGQLRLKYDTHDLWEFRAASASTADGTTVIAPTSGTGRWHVQTGGGGGSGSGSADNVEILAQKLENERTANSITESLDNSCGISGRITPYHKNFVGRLIQSESSGVSTLYMVWNPVVVNDSDKNYDSISSWSAVGDATTLAASATTPKFGTNKFTFNKSNTQVSAGIRYDRAAQTLNLGVSTRAWFWVNMPSVTNLSNIYLRIYADSTSNYRTWTCTTDYAGNALAVGWNLLFVDISTGGTATGTGWVYTSLSRYQEIGVTASSSAQQYTAIAFDGLFFSYGNITELGAIDKQFTIYNTSNRESIILASSNTRPDGPVTLAAATTNAWTCGISNSDAAGIQRSTLAFSNDVIVFDSALSSGTISTTQEARISTIQRESLSQNLKGFVDISTPQFYRVTSIPGGTTIAVDDPADTTTNLTSGTTVDVFDCTYNNGERFFQYSTTLTLSSGSTASGGTTTLTVASSAGISAGQYVAKRHHTTTISCVAKTTNENFQSPTLSTAPNGIQVLDSGLFYPNAANVYGHWYLGGISSGEALKNRYGTGDLSSTGAMNTTDSFLYGRNSASGYTTTAYLTRVVGTLLDGLSELVQGSVWVYYDGATVAQPRDIVTCWERYGDNTRVGWRLTVLDSTATIQFAHNNGTTSDTTQTTSSLLTTGWNHVAWAIQSGTIKQIWVNGVLETASAPTISAVSAGAYIGVGIRYDANNSPAVAGQGTNLKMADLILWRSGSTLTTAQVQTLGNSKIFRPVGYSPRMRYVYELSSQTGQKISMNTSLTRTTTAVSPVILKMGTIKV